MYPIERLAAANSDPLFRHFPQQFNVMHWHNDMPGITDGAVLLSKSAGCPQQAFRYGERVYGFQFHLEFTRTVVEKIVAHCPHDLRPNKYVRSKAELLNTDFSEINEKMRFVLEYMASLR